MDEAFVLKMLGDYNVENALAAVAATDVLGIPVEAAKTALKDVHVPGRMRLVSSADYRKKIIAIADFAHNRLSFERLITGMKEAHPEYKVVSIFGAPPEKALERHEELGTVGGKYSDYVYITMDDPGLENIKDISEEIAYYVEREGTPFTYIENRQEAIRTLEKVEGKTLILALGKGHEKTMKIGDRDVPMRSDEEIIHECMKNTINN